MSFLGNVGQTLRQPGLGDRLAAAFATANGDPNAAYRYQELQRQNQQLALQQQAAQQARQDRNDQVWGAKESGLFSNPEIALMSSSDLSQAAREQGARFTLSPGQESHRPGRNGRAEEVTRAPIAEAQMGNWLDTQDPSGRLRAVYARRQAMPPMATQPGGGVVGLNDNNQMGYLVGQDGAASAQTATSAPPGVPADLWQRMIRQESGGRQFGANGAPLRSPAGAIGIAQIMPSTGPTAAGYAGVPYDPARLANDAQYNEQLGQAYFQHLLQQFGDPAQAAAAYNAGPNRVSRAIQRGGPDWQQYIPTETRNYVANVTGRGSLTSAPRQPVVANTAADAAALPPGTVFLYHGQRRVRH